MEMVPASEPALRLLKNTLRGSRFQPATRFPPVRPARRNPTIGIAGRCCSRAANGHAAAPPSSVMKSRRLMPNMGLPPKGAAADHTS